MVKYLFKSLFFSPSCHKSGEFSDRVCRSPAVHAPQIHGFADNGVRVVLRNLQKIGTRSLLRALHLDCFIQNKDFEFPVQILSLYKKENETRIPSPCPRVPPSLSPAHTILHPGFGQKAFISKMLISSQASHTSHIPDTRHYPHCLSMTTNCIS